MWSGSSRCWARAALARNLRLELFQLNEVVGLAAKLVRHHRRLRADRRDHADATALALGSLDQAAEIPVPGKDHDMVDLFGHFHNIDGKFDVHVALHAAATLRVGELLEWFGDDRKAVVVQP